MRLIRKAIPVLIAILTACSLVVSAEDTADYSKTPDGQSSSQSSSQEADGGQSQEEGEAAASNAVAPLYFDAATMEQLHGTWKGRFHTPLIPVETLTYFEDAVELNIIDDGGQPKLYITVDSFGSNYTQAIQWWATNGELHFIFNELPWQATVAVKLSGESTLTGTYSQYGREYEMNFYRASNVPVRKDQESQFTFEDEPFEVWQERLQKYSEFSGGAKAPIPFTYELYATDKSRELLNAANFAGAAYQPYNSDVEQMAAIMDVLCDRFLHNGASGMPEATDTTSIMYFANENNGVECRGLSAMLSEVLRSVGIPAKPVMCIPYNDPCEDCHVVVHAWSHDLRQWVMLDPTYRLVLRDIDGNYLSIPQIREKLLSGEQMVANSNAGHNGTPFSMEYYRAYMTKNMFRFSSLTNSVFEGEKAPGGNRTRMLVPKGWQLPYAWSRPEIVTNDADAFWAAPKIDSDYE